MSQNFELGKFGQRVSVNTTANSITVNTPINANTVNAVSYTVSTWGTSANAFTANSTLVGWGNNSSNVVMSWDSTGQDLLAIAGNINNYVEAVIWNSNTGTSVSSDFSINDNFGIYSNNYIDIGINGSNWSNSQWTINGPSDGYVYTGNTNLGIGTGGAQGNIVFFTAGTLAANERMRITTTGNIGINTTSPNSALSVNGAIVANNISLNGANVGYMEVPQNSQTAAYTTILSDTGKHLLHPSTDNNARTFTIANNSTVAYPIGTMITFVNMANVMTIAINNDTMYLSSNGATGSRSLNTYGIASAIKIGTTSWLISGTNLT